MKNEILAIFCFIIFCCYVRYWRKLVCVPRRTRFVFRKSFTGWSISFKSNKYNPRERVVIVCLTYIKRVAVLYIKYVKLWCTCGCNEKSFIITKLMDIIYFSFL